MPAVSAEMLALARGVLVAVANEEGAVTKTSPAMHRDATDNFFIEFPVVFLFDGFR